MAMDNRLLIPGGVTLKEIVEEEKKKNGAKNSYSVQKGGGSKSAGTAGENGAARRESNGSGRKTAGGSQGAVGTVGPFSPVSGANASLERLKIRILGSGAGTAGTNGAAGTNGKDIDIYRGGAARRRTNVPAATGETKDVDIYRGGAARRRSNVPVVRMGVPAVTNTVDPVTADYLSRVSPVQRTMEKYGLAPISDFDRILSMNRVSARDAYENSLEKQFSSFSSSQLLDRIEQNERARNNTNRPDVAAGYERQNKVLAQLTTKKQAEERQKEEETKQKVARRYDRMLQREVEKKYGLDPYTSTLSDIQEVIWRNEKSIGNAKTQADAEALVRDNQILGDMLGKNSIYRETERGKQLIKFETLEKQPDFFSRQGVNKKERDRVYRAINNVDGYGDYVKAYEEGGPVPQVSSGKTFSYVDTDDRKYLFMTALEKSRYNYLYNAEGKRAAKGYLELLEPDLNKRQTEDKAKSAAAFAQEHPVAASVISLAESPARGLAGGISTIGDVGAVLSGKEIDPYGKYKQLAHTAQAVRETVSSSLNKDWQRFLYNAGMSVGDNVIEMGVMSLLTAGAAPALKAIDSAADLAKAVSALNKITKYGVSGMVFGDVAASTVISGKAKGYSDAKALSLGLVSALIEGATEKWSLDVILKKPKTLFTSVLRGMAAEGSEEGLSAAANMVVDGLVNGSDADIVKRIQELKENGYSNKGALALALTEGILPDMAAGALGGGLMGGLHFGASNLFDTGGGKPKTAEGVTVFDANSGNGGMFDQIVRMNKEQGREAQNGTSVKDGGQNGADNGILYSIHYDKNNVPFVEVDDDVLEGLSQKEKQARVKQILKDRFSQGISVGNEQIYVSKKSRDEFLNSNYSQSLKNNQPFIYDDKLRSSNNLDEILQASTDYVNEGLKHSRKDNFKEFSRGKVNLRIGGKDYIAEIIIGNTKKNNLVFYDLINLKPAKINERVPVTTKVNDNLHDSLDKDTLSNSSIPQGNEKYNPETQKNVSIGRTGKNGDVFGQIANMGKEQGESAQNETGAKNDGRNGPVYSTSDAENGGSPFGAVYTNDSGGAELDFESFKKAARQLGFKVVDTPVNDALERVDGYVDLGRREIYVNPNAQDPASVVMKHELTHVLENINSEYLNKAKDYLRQQFGEEWEQRRREILEKHNQINSQNPENAIKITDSLLDSETMAELSSYLATDQAIARFASGDARFCRNVSLWFSYIAKQIKAVFGDLTTVEKLEVAAYKWEQALRKAEKGTNSGTGGVVYYSKNDSKSLSIKAQIRAHINEIMLHPVVKRISFVKDAGETMAEVRNRIYKTFLENNDGKKELTVDRKGFGTVQVGLNEMKAGMKYLGSFNELASIDAIADVIQNGVQINVNEDHKNRAYPTFTFAAPVEVNDVTYAMAVVVKRTSENKYKVHRLMMPTGATLEITDVENNKAAKATPSEMTAVSDGERPPITFAADNSVSQSEASVNSNDMQFGEKDAGLKFLFAGQTSKTADPEALKKAKGLAAFGMPPEQIFRETGYVQGLDGKWRFELDDSRLKLKTENEKLHDVFRINELNQKDLMRELTEAEETEFLRLRQKASRGELSAPLSKLIDYDGLFLAYPFLRKVIVKSDYHAVPMGMAAYSPKDNVIYISPQHSGRGLKQTLIHEIQHAIQNKEGFSGGSSPEYWRRKSGVSQAAARSYYRNTVGEIEARDAAGRANLTEEERRNVFPESAKPNEDAVFVAGEQDLFLAKDEDLSRFSNQIKQWQRGEMSSTEPFELGKTPFVLQKIGADNLPVIMTQKVMEKVTGGKHDIGFSEIKNLPQNLADPVMVFRSATQKNAFVVLTEMVDQNGDSVICALHLNRTEKHMNVNRIASVYGKEHIDHFVRKQAEADNLLYMDKKKCQQWSQSRGLQLPKLADTIADNNNILQKSDIVNSYFMPENDHYTENESRQQSTSGGLQLPKLVQSIADTDSVPQREPTVNRNFMQYSEKNVENSASFRTIDVVSEELLELDKLLDDENLTDEEFRKLDRKSRKLERELAILTARHAQGSGTAGISGMVGVTGGQTTGTGGMNSRGNLLEDSGQQGTEAASRGRDGSGNVPSSPEWFRPSGKLGDWHDAVEEFHETGNADGIPTRQSAKQSQKYYVQQVNSLGNEIANVEAALLGNDLTALERENATARRAALLMRRREAVSKTKVLSEVLDILDEIDTLARPNHKWVGGISADLSDKRNVLKFGTYGMNDFERNVKHFFGKKHFKTAYEKILRPLYESKKAYAKGVAAYSDLIYKSVVKGLGIKKGSRMSAAVQWLGEGEKPVSKKAGADLIPYSYDDCVSEFGKEKAERIKKAAEIFRSCYDNLIDDVNATRKMLYPNNPEKLIQKRKDYFRHFQEESNNLQGFRNTMHNHLGIDPELVGVSEVTKPKTKWQSMAQERTGNRTAYDAVGGFLDYLPQAEYAIFIDPNIVNIRSLAFDLASAKAKEGTNGNPDANGFIRYLQKYANRLAGKTTSAFDRALADSTVGRPAIAALAWFNNRMKANAVLGNFSSVVAQLQNITNITGKIKRETDILKGAAQALAGLFGDRKIRGLYEESGFLQERFLDKKLNRFEKKMSPTRWAAAVLGIADEIGTRITWNAAYHEGKRILPENPVQYADDLTRSSVAGRGIGETPLMFESQLGKLFLPFRVEVMNTVNVWQDILFDDSKDTKVKNAAHNVLKFTEYAVACAVVNALIAGLKSDEFDPVDDVEEGLKKAQEEAGSDVWKRAGLSVLRPAQELYGDWADGYGNAVGADFLHGVVSGLSQAQEEAGGDPYRRAGLSLLRPIQNLAGDVTSNHPLSQAALGILGLDSNTTDFLFNGSVYNAGGAGMPAASTISSAFKKLGKGEAAAASAEVLKSFALPWGGSQADKTVRGLYEFFNGGTTKNAYERMWNEWARQGQDGYVPGSDSEFKKRKGTLKYLVEPTGENFVKSALFGPAAFGGAADEYYGDKTRRMDEDETEKILSQDGYGPRKITFDEILAEHVYNAEKNDRVQTAANAFFDGKDTGNEQGPGVDLGDETAGSELYAMYLSGNKKTVPFRNIPLDLSVTIDEKKYEAHLAPEDAKKMEETLSNRLKERFEELDRSEKFSALSAKEKESVLNSFVGYEVTRVKAEHFLSVGDMTQDAFDAYDLSYRRSVAKKEREIYVSDGAAFVAYNAVNVEKQFVQYAPKVTQETRRQAKKYGEFASTREPDEVDLELLRISNLTGSDMNVGGNPSGILSYSYKKQSYIIDMPDTEVYALMDTVERSCRAALKKEFQTARYKNADAVKKKDIIAAVKADVRKRVKEMYKKKYQSVKVDKFEEIRNMK